VFGTGLPKLGKDTGSHIIKLTCKLGVEEKT